MEVITFKHKALELKNVSPFMMFLIEIGKQRRERARLRIQRILRKEGLKLDKAIMGER